MSAVTASSSIHQVAISTGSVFAGWYVCAPSEYQLEVQTTQHQGHATDGQTIQLDVVIVFYDSGVGIDADSLE